MQKKEMEMNKAIFYGTLSISALGVLVYLSLDDKPKPQRLGRKNDGTPWTLTYTTRARKELASLRGADKEKALQIISDIQRDPYERKDHLEKLKKVENTYSRRLSFKDRIVYAIDSNAHRVEILSVWGHYTRYNSEDI